MSLKLAGVGVEERLGGGMDGVETGGLRERAKTGEARGTSEIEKNGKSGKENRRERKERSRRKNGENRRDRSVGASFGRKPVRRGVRLVASAVKLDATVNV